MQLMGLDQGWEQEYQYAMNKDAAIIDGVVARAISLLGPTLEAAPATKAKPNAALKASTLKRDDMPMTMRVGIDQYEAYHRTSNLDLLPNKDQQAYFLTLLGTSLRARITGSLTDDIPVQWFNDSSTPSLPTQPLPTQSILTQPLPTQHIATQNPY